MKILIYFCVCFIVLIVIGFSIRKQDVIVNEDNEFIYVKQYSLFNFSNSINKYRKSIYHNAKCIYKRESFNYNFILNILETKYFVKIKYEDNVFEKESYSLYQSLNIGDSCKVIENFYPEHYVSIEKY